MGKSNRIRANRASGAVKAPASKKTHKQKKGMPGWLMTLITVVLAVILLASVTLSVLAAYGVPNRLRTSFKTENYRINANMMSYYFFTTYQNFQTSYESYLDYFSLDTSRSLKEQPFGGDPADTSTTYYDTYLLGSFEGTWFDYFVEATKEQAVNIMIYLEEAEARGITLTDEEKDSIKASLEETTTTMAQYYSSANAYLSDVYGKGVSKSDVLKAMEYSTLAEKAMNAITDELQGQITDELIASTYAADKKSFDVVDYSYYTFTVDYDDVAEETLGAEYESLLENNAENQAKALEAYKAAIAKAQADAEALAKNTDATAFQKALLSIVVEEAYAELYASEVTSEQEGTVSAENKTKIQEQMIAEVIADAMGETADDEADSITISEDETTGKAYGIDVSGSYAAALEEIKTSLDSDASSALTTYIQDKATYTDDDEFSEWAFGEGIAAGSTKQITEGDGADEEITAKTGYTYVSIYLIRTAPHADEEKTRNVAYALFTSEAAAQAAIEVLKTSGTFDVAGFEQSMNEQGATGAANMEDCYEGALGSTTFDNWLFGETTTIGAYTDTPLKLDDSSYCVAYYHADGMEKWKVTVSSSILDEKFNAYFTDMEAKYPVTVKENSFKQIDA